MGDIENIHVLPVHLAGLVGHKKHYSHLPFCCHSKNLFWHGQMNHCLIR